MPENPADLNKPLSHQERLAAKLRENLRRRKAQARDLAEETGGGPGALPKSSGKS